MLRCRDILPLVTLDLEPVAPDAGERDVEIRPGDVEIDVRGGVVLL